MGNYYYNKLNFINKKTSRDLEVHRSIDGLGFEHYPTDYRVNIDSKKDVIFNKLHYESAIETKPEYMTDELIPSDVFTLDKPPENRLAIRNLSIYVIMYISIF